MLTYSKRLLNLSYPQILWITLLISPAHAPLVTVFITVLLHCLLFGLLLISLLINKMQALSEKQRKRLTLILQFIVLCGLQQELPASWRARHPPVKSWARSWQSFLVAV